MISISWRVFRSICSYFGREKVGGVIREGRVKPEVKEVIAPE